MGERRLEGRTAVVTGAGRGIGREVALALAREGANVVVNDYGVNVDGTQPSEGPAKDVADEIRASGGSAVPNFDTVATVEGGERMVQQALDTFGRLDILINVAGILRDRMIFNMSEEEWDAVIAVHLKGHYCTTKPASVVMRQQRYGRIINFSSISGLGGLPGQANYGAAKAGIAGFTRVVARDLGRYGVTCNAIADDADHPPAGAAASRPRRCADACRRSAPLERSGDERSFVRGAHDRLPVPGRGLEHQREGVLHLGRTRLAGSRGDADADHHQAGDVDHRRAGAARSPRADAGASEPCAPST